MPTFQARQCSSFPCVARSSSGPRHNKVRGVHSPSPLGVGTPSSFKVRAIPRSDAVRSGSTRSTMGAIDRACSVAFSVRAARALAVSVAVPGRPRKPPNLFPRALLAANAAFVRAEIMPASSSATAIMICRRKRPVGLQSEGGRRSGHRHLLQGSVTGSFANEPGGPPWQLPVLHGAPDTSPMWLTRGGAHPATNCRAGHSISSATSTPTGGGPACSTCSTTSTASAWRRYRTSRCRACG